MQHCCSCLIHSLKPHSSEPALKKQRALVYDSSDSGRAGQSQVSSELLKPTKSSKGQRKSLRTERPLTLQVPWRKQGTIPKLHAMNTGFIPALCPHSWPFSTHTFSPSFSQGLCRHSESLESCTLLSASLKENAGKGLWDHSAISKQTLVLHLCSWNTIVKYPLNTEAMSQQHFLASY